MRPPQERTHGGTYGELAHGDGLPMVHRMHLFEAQLLGHSCARWRGHDGLVLWDPLQSRSVCMII